MATSRREPKVEYTERGFQIIRFTDRYGEDCSLQQSSLADYEQPGSSAIWLGPVGERMHLDREQVAWLRDVLTRWLDSGQFDERLEALADALGAL